MHEADPEALILTDLGGRGVCDYIRDASRSISIDLDVGQLV